ncbi:MAG: prolyl oligopeptidase family serine peptidase, partial [Clostridia bacterium]|nr:prolyl oligopeptidase family serine peptidase [Clostridia bacterium]
KWSPDGGKIAACLQYNDGIRLWIADVSTLTARKVSDKKMNLFFGTKMYSWSPDSKNLIATFIPDNRGEEPANESTIVPVIQSSDGKNNPAPTYQDLLTDKFSEMLFDYYATSELGVITVETEKIKYNGSKAIYTNASFSPDGNYLLVHTTYRPYSYVVPYNFFPSTIEVRTTQGEQIKIIHKKPLIEFEYISNNSASPEPRDYGWRADSPASVFWVEPLDQGNGRALVEFRDRVMLLNAPFTEEPQELIKTEFRFDELLWGNDKNAFVLMYDYATRTKKCSHFNPTDHKIIQEIYSHSSEDLYADWGKFILSKNNFKQDVVLSEDGYKTVFFCGNGFSPEGALPFIDARNLRKNTTTRLWQSRNPFYELPVSFHNLSKGEIVTQLESNSDCPNYYLRNLKSNTLTTLTNFKNPYPAMKGVTRELIEYTRKDGVKLSGTLYLPAGYKKEDGPLPVLIWAYPSEFKSSANAGQRNDAPNQFIRYTRLSPVVWVAEGYAVLNNASFPIIGEGDSEPNDTYIEQLVNNAEAAVEKLVDMGVGDRKRMAVGGHSYGAFMTANLLANTDLFAAGIARSGAYNRTLTPFGFQNEMRTFWEAPDVYMKMSPFAKADKLKIPLLLIHGQADNNTGTFTMQSERLFSALKGNGGTVRLVLLPYENHGYVARESILHQAWETYQWLEKYVKNRR